MMPESEKILAMCEFDSSKLYLNQYDTTFGDYALQENARLLPIIKALLADRERLREVMRGCSDGNCRVITRRTGGQHTNGGCRCVDNIKHALTASQATDDLILKGESK